MYVNQYPGSCFLKATNGKKNYIKMMRALSLIVSLIFFVFFVFDTSFNFLSSYHTGHILTVIPPTTKQNAANTPYNNMALSKYQDQLYSYSWLSCSTDAIILARNKNIKLIISRRPKKIQPYLSLKQKKFWTTGTHA